MVFYYCCMHDSDSSSSCKTNAIYICIYIYVNAPVFQHIVSRVTASTQSHEWLLINKFNITIIGSSLQYKQKNTLLTIPLYENNLSSHITPPRRVIPFSITALPLAVAAPLSFLLIQEKMKRCLFNIYGRRITTGLVHEHIRITSWRLFRDVLMPEIKMSHHDCENHGWGSVGRQKQAWKWTRDLLVAEKNSMFCIVERGGWCGTAVGAGDKWGSEANSSSSAMPRAT